MKRQKRLFERVPLDQVRHLQKLDSTEQTKPAKSPATNIVPKRAVRPKRSIKTDGDDHAVGLWIDKDLLRKHQNRTPQIVLHHALASTNNRYLRLADLALSRSHPKSRKTGNASIERMPRI